MKVQYEYLLFGFMGEFFGTVYTLKEAKAHKAKVPSAYYYRKQERLD